MARAIITYKVNMLSPTEIKCFFDDGFVVLREKVSESFCRPALGALNQWHCKLRELSPEERVNYWVRDQAPESYALPFWQHLTILTNDCASQLLGNSKLLGHQLIGSDGNQKSNGFKTSWHLDTVEVIKRDGLIGDFPQFHLIIGIYLTPMEVNNCGNLIVWRGSHWKIANYFSRSPDKATRAASLYRDLNGQIGEPEQICGQSGDIVLMNSFLAHETGMNSSGRFSGRSYVRYVASPQSKLSDWSAASPWINWRGMDPYRREASSHNCN